MSLRLAGNFFEPETMVGKVRISRDQAAAATAPAPDIANVARRIWPATCRDQRVAHAWPERRRKVFAHE